MVTLVPLYPAALLAKLTAGVDVASRGRFELGVGVGGEFAKEFEACGVPVDERGARTNEALELLNFIPRKAARLLRKTLIPVSPGYKYVQQTRGQLQQQAVLVYAQPQRNQQRWLMVGGVLGSALSIGGLIAAVLLRRRNNEQKAKE